MWVLSTVETEDRERGTDVGRGSGTVGGQEEGNLSWNKLTGCYEEIVEGPV